MPKQVTSAEHGAPVVITRRGRAVAVIVATDEFERLERLTAAGPQAGRAGLAGGWEGSEDLVRELEARRRAPPRHPPEVDGRWPSSSTPTPSARRSSGAS